MRKIAVIFPGVGYTKDRPLLYYSGKQAALCGYELHHIDFSGISWSKEKLKDRHFLLRTLERCLAITEDALAGIAYQPEDELLFISKSIGTVVATAYAKKKQIYARQICFSPLEMIEDYITEGNGILFYGNDDPYADHKAIEKTGSRKNLEMHCINGGNHSLETGDPCKDIDNLKEVILQVRCSLSKDP